MDAIAETLDRFSKKVNKTYNDIRVVRVPSIDDSIVRFLVAPADKFLDTQPDYEKARQEQAGALPPEIYGHDLFELVKGNVVRLRDGSRVGFQDEKGLNSILSRFLDLTSFDGQSLIRLVELIREGQKFSRVPSTSSRLER